MVPRFGPARRAVRRFMPGERLSEALDAAAQIEEGGAGVVLSHLGEDLDDPDGVEEVVQEYLHALERIAGEGLEVEISVKLSQLGLSLDPEICRAALGRLAENAARTGAYLWIDMERSCDVDATLELFGGILRGHGPAGVCLQAYLHRTPQDIDRLLDARFHRGTPPGIRLVKGAYQEPPEVALQDRSAIDGRFEELARRLLVRRADLPGLRLALGTHDEHLIQQFRGDVSTVGASPRDQAVEFHLLYGIRTDLQSDLMRSETPLRIFINYGAAWYPWYVRRLAERPANLLLLARALLPGGADAKG